jgi:hypothetical protein
MKKNLIALSLITSFSAGATNYVVVIDKENNDYVNDLITQEITYSEWVEVSNNCVNDKELEDVYFGKTFDQESTCTKTEERTKYTKNTYSSGKEEILESKESKSESTSTTNTVTGIHLEESCKKALDFDSTIEDGFLTLKLKDNNNYELYCDMENGGYTLISHVFDRDNRDDILNNSNGAGWGSLKNTPESDTSFNLANNLTPDFTKADWEWIHTVENEVYRHSNADFWSLTTNRFAWINPNSPNTNLIADITTDLNITEGNFAGVFGDHVNHANSFGFLPDNHNCGSGGHVNNKAMHYWGFGSIIAYGNDSTNELHNLRDGVQRAGGTSNPNGCGTRNTILNIWIK